VRSYVAMTGNTSTRDNQRYYAMGFDVVLPKPFTRESLGRALLLATVDKSHGPASRAVQSLLAQFLDASGRASVATMPLQVYAVAAEGLKQAAAAGTVSASMRARRLGQYTPTPCFRLVLRPRFAPWPLEIHLAD
jgi:CheY-like chemotaxis protein